MKTYSNKSNAVRAMNTYTQKVQQYLKGAEVVEYDNAFAVSFSMDSETPDEMIAMLGEKFIVSTVKPEPVVGEFVNCPDCGIHLSNGVSCYETQRQIAAQENAPEARIKKEYVCLACDHEFGEVVKTAKANSSNTASNATGNGLKIQKNREERNGVKRPSNGGKCAQLWDLFDAMYAEKGIVPTPKPAKQRSAELGLDPVTTQVQLYRWREFMGFKGK